MRKMMMLGAVLAAGGLAAGVPALAKGHKSHKCLVHSEDYRASGTLVSFAGTPAAGKNRYDGTITVNVTRANHHGATGTQTYTLSDTKVIFHRGASASDTTPDRVTLVGRITTLAKKCDHTGFTPMTTLKRVDVRRPAHK